MTFITLALIHFLACVTPGPALMYAFDVLTETNLRNATKVVIGITLGNALEILLSVLGISILAKIAKEYPSFFYLACAGLLFYLGGKSLIASMKKDYQQKNSINSNKYILTGFIMILLNPKALIFWSLMLSPVVINYSAIGKILTTAYFVIAGFTFVLIDVYLFSFFKAKMMKYLQVVQGVLGVVMIGFGVMLIIKSKIFLLF